jgi:hypothetical protein
VGAHFHHGHVSGGIQLWFAKIVSLDATIQPERLGQIQFLQLAQLRTLDQNLMLTVIFAGCRSSKPTRSQRSDSTDLIVVAEQSLGKR